MKLSVALRSIKLRQVIVSLRGYQMLFELGSDPMISEIGGGTETPLSLTGWNLRSTYWSRTNLTIFPAVLLRTTARDYRIDHMTSIYDETAKDQKQSSNS